MLIEPGYSYLLCSAIIIFSLIFIEAKKYQKRKNRIDNLKEYKN